MQRKGVAPVIHRYHDLLRVVLAGELEERRAKREQTFGGHEHAVALRTHIAEDHEATPVAATPELRDAHGLAPAAEHEYPPLEDVFVHEAHEEQTNQG